MARGLDIVFMGFSVSDWAPEPWNVRNPMGWEDVAHAASRDCEHEIKEAPVIRNRVKVVAGLVAAGLLGLNGQAVQAQVDMSGTWNLEVESQNGVTNPVLMLEQDGVSLTGHYSSETLGDADVTGSVSGNSVTVDFSAMLEGVGEAPLTYSGSVSDEGVWSGELVADVQGQIFPIGTFTATKQ